MIDRGHANVTREACSVHNWANKLGRNQDLGYTQQEIALQVNDNNTVIRGLVRRGKMGLGKIERWLDVKFQNEVRNYISP